jgi:hypothetical protein
MRIDNLNGGISVPKHSLDYKDTVQVFEEVIENTVSQDVDPAVEFITVSHKKERRKKKRDMGASAITEVAKEQLLEKSSTGNKLHANDTQGKNYQIGSHVDEDKVSKFSAAPRKIWIYVGKVNKEVTEADIISYLVERFPQHTFSCDKLVTLGEFAAFKVGANAQLADDLFRGDTWPVGVLYRRFFVKKVNKDTDANVANVQQWLTSSGSCGASQAVVSEEPVQVTGVVHAPEKMKTRGQLGVVKPKEK